MPPSHLILCRPLLLLPPMPPNIRVFSNESTLRMRWPNYWSFSFSIIPSKEIPGLIFRMDWLISLQSKGLSRVFSNTTDQKHQFFGALLSLLSSSCIHTWLLEKTPLTIRTFVSKVMSLLFNTLHSFPTKEQLSSNFMAAVTICSDFRAQEVEICHCFHLFPFCLLWSDGTGCHDLSFLNIEF